MASRTTRSKATPKKTQTPPKVKQEEPKAEEKEQVKGAAPEVKDKADPEKKEAKTEVKKEEPTEEPEEETTENGEPEVEDDANDEVVDEDKLLDGNDDEEEMEEETEAKEGEEETKEEEEEKKEKEGEEETEEKKEETTTEETTTEETTTEEDEKKAAEKKAADKKAAEKKAADEKKNKMYIPTAGKYNQDEHVYMRLRSVVVGPLELEDLQNDIVKDMANKAEEFFYRFHFIEKEDKHVGHIEFRFKSIAEADEMIETLKTIKEGVVVKRLVGGMNAAKFDKDVRGINDDAEKEKYKRIVAVGGVPESATQEKLQEVFPDARVKFIALKPDGTPKWYAYLELDDEETAQKVAEQYKEVEFEGENLYCRCLRPGKPEDPEYETNPDHVLTDEERKKVQARINNMKYKLNGGAVLRPLDAQRLKRRVSQLTGLLRASNNRRKDGTKEPTDKANAAKPPSKTGTTPKRGDQAVGNRRTAMRGNRGRGGMQGGSGMRQNRGGRQGGWQGGSGWQGGPGPNVNRNMGNSSFRGNQRAPAMPMGSPRQQGSFYGGRGGSPARNVGSSGGGGRSNMYNNPQQTANAVNMLVGLTNLLSQARNQGGQGGGNQAGGNQANYSQQQAGASYAGGSGGGGYSSGYERGDNYERGSYGGSSGYSGGGYSGGSSFNNGGNHNSGGYSGGYGSGVGGGFGSGSGNFNNRKRTYSGNRRGQGTPAKQNRRFGGWN